MWVRFCVVFALYYSTHFDISLATSYGVFVLCTGRRSFGDFSAILTCHSLKSGCPVFQRHQISVS